MKKILTAVLVLVFLTGMFVGCGPAATDQSTATQTQKPTQAPQATQSPEATEAFEVLDSNVTLWKNSIGTIWGQLIVEVQNTGTAPLYLTSSDFDLVFVWSLLLIKLAYFCFALL